jgi:hypothetical protein
MVRYGSCPGGARKRTEVSNKRERCLLQAPSEWFHPRRPEVGRRGLRFACRTLRREVAPGPPKVVSGGKVGMGWNPSASAPAFQPMPTLGPVEPYLY